MQKKNSSRDAEYTARKAGIIGFGQLCRKQIFCVNDDDSLDISAIRTAIEESDNKILIYGFTHVVWSVLRNKTIDEDLKNELKRRSVLLHGGGWKKIENEKVSRKDYIS